MIVAYDIMGDANGDGYVTLKDAVAIIKAMSGK